MKNPDWSADFIARKNSTQAIPIEIYDIHLGEQTSVDENTLFLNSSNYNFRFYPYTDMQNIQNYIALGLDRGAISHTADMSIDGMNLKLDNISQTFSTLFTQYDFRGKRIIIRQVYGDLLTNSGDFALLFDGILDSPKMSLKDGMKVETRHSVIDSLNYAIPKEKYSIHCNNVFCGTECAGGITAAALKNKKTAQTIDTVSGDAWFTDAARTEADNYYTPGIMEMTGGTANNIGEKRRITETTGDNIRIDYAFPSTVVIGDEYSIERDCDKTELQCMGDFENGANFRGFKYLPLNMIVR